MNANLEPMNRFNRLGGEKSPYLLQHKENPVNWFPWGNDAFETARAENKPIFLSIGYSTCYWCHMMEKDSFEQHDVADILNRHFVSIKLDREERPDIDKIYMDAVVGLTGHGGWPMSVFLTPDLRPFHAGTFFWKPQFIQLLSKVAELWEESPDQLRTASERITEALQHSAPKAAALNSVELFRQCFDSLMGSFDENLGGFGRAPKFPQSERIRLLLRLHRRSGSVQALKMATKTLKAMASGGIYDHLGGGFHRYSTDEQWLVPHFEKMLYDNALLAATYVEAYQVSASSFFAEAAKGTLDYIARDLKSPAGGFFCAEDAGEVGREGEFYVWNYIDLKDVLAEDELEYLSVSYNVPVAGNFEGKIILALKPEAAAAFDDPKLKEIKSKLFEARSSRVRPGLDRKVLTSWSALAVSAFALGARAFGEDRYYRTASDAFRFLIENLHPHDRLYHRYCDGEAAVPGLLEDYAYLIHAALDLYEADFDGNRLARALELQREQDEFFWDPLGGGYFYSVSDDPSVIIRQKEYQDGATPSANAFSAHNLCRLFALTGDTHFQERLEKLLASIPEDIENYPFGFTGLLSAIDLKEDCLEIAAAGPKEAPEIKELLSFINKTFLPNKVIALNDPRDLTFKAPLVEDKIELEGKPAFYICRNQICSVPTNDVEEAKKWAAEPSPLSLEMQD